MTIEPLLIFQEKMPIAKVKKELHDLFCTESKRLELESQEYLLKKGVDLFIDEFSALITLAEKYHAPYLKWTGGQNNPFDGILFFDTKEQKIEVSRILNEQALKDEKEHGQSNFFYTRSGSDFDLKSDDDIRSFIYHRLVRILEKKNHKKYKGLWLCIAYQIMKLPFNKPDVHEPILRKIQDKEKNLLSSIHEVFTKVIFVPNRIHLMKLSEPQSYQSFEWQK